MVKWALAVIGATVVAAGLWAFEPWRAFTSSEIDEALPQVIAVQPTATPTNRAAVPVAPAPSPEVVSTGAFVDGEHGTSGTATILQLADGRRFLRLENLSTSDGPDVHVWLSAAKAGGSWGKYDDGAYLKLGHLKATHGNQNYPIPQNADLSRMRSAVIWCDRFNVAFGSAPVSLG